MDKILLTARAAIHEGKLEELKSLSAECKRKVRENEPDTLQYDWFLNSAQTECVVLETYSSSAAVLHHIANLGPTLAALLAIGDWTFEVFGSPSQELAAATASLNLTIYSPLQDV